jgi:hypothetical protein
MQLVGTFTGRRTASPTAAEASELPVGHAALVPTARRSATGRAHAWAGESDDRLPSPSPAFAFAARLRCARGTLAQL